MQLSIWYDFNYLAFTFIALEKSSGNWEVLLIVSTIASTFERIYLRPW